VLVVHDLGLAYEQVERDVAGVDECGLARAGLLLGPSEVVFGVDALASLGPECFA